KRLQGHQDQALPAILRPDACSVPPDPDNSRRPRRDLSVAGTRREIARSRIMSQAVRIVAGKLLFLTTACLVPLGLLSWSARSSQDEPIDFDKARQLRQRMLQGERLGAAERAYLERAKAAFQKKQAGIRKGIVRGGQDHLGLVPLSDLAGAARYK